MGSPLWKRGVRGDFVNIFDSIGVIALIRTRHHLSVWELCLRGKKGLFHSLNVAISLLGFKKRSKAL